MFYDLTTDELISIDGGDFYSILMKTCEFIFVGAVGTIFGAVGGAAGTFIAGGPGVGTALGAVAGGYVGAVAGQAIWNMLFKG